MNTCLEKNHRSCKSVKRNPSCCFSSITFLLLNQSHHLSTFTYKRFVCHFASPKIVDHVPWVSDNCVPLLSFLHLHSLKQIEKWKYLYIGFLKQLDSHFMASLQLICRMQGQSHLRHCQPLASPHLLHHRGFFNISKYVYVYIHLKTSITS